MSRRLPAEWEPQSAILLTWPHADSDWRDDLARVESVYRAVLAALAPRQALLIVCASKSHRRHVAAQCPMQHAARIHLAIAPSDDSWSRDHGPISVLDHGKPLLLDFDFNGWGGKYPATRDNAITATLHRAGVWPGVALARPGIVLEGGAIETDGQGSLLATRPSILDPRRGHTDQARLEQQLREWLGIRHFQWLNHGRLEGDDTDGHIDTLARYVEPGHIIHVSARPDDPDHTGIRAMIEELRALRDPDNQPLRLTALPAPPPLHNASGRRLATSYANFLIANGQLLAPVYGLESDTAALATLADCFPRHSISAIDCRPLIEQNGSLHCITRQLPAAVPLNPALRLRP